MRLLFDKGMEGRTITYLPSTRQGQFYRLYLIMDIYSRKIVGWEIHENESATHAATMLAKLQQPGIMPSFSRPSVSNDNPYSESLFRTLKGISKNL